MRILVDYGFSDNYGDIGMLEGAISMLRSSLPSAQPLVMDRPFLRDFPWHRYGAARHPDYWIEPVGARLLSRIPPLAVRSHAWRRHAYKLTSLVRGRRLVPADGKDSPATLEEYCKPLDALLISGGGNLTDTFPGELFHKTSLMHAFIRQGKPVVLTGQQIGPFKSWIFKRSLSQALRKVRFVGLREDGVSLDFCKNIPLEAGRFALLGDDSLGLEPSADSEVADLLHSVGLKPKAFLAANFRIGFYTPELRPQFEKVSAMLRRLGSYFDIPVLLVPIARNAGDDDGVSGQRLARELGVERARVLDSSKLSPSLAKGLMGNCFGAVGVSYHFCTFALSQGVPAIALYDGKYYAQKAQGLARFWQDERLALCVSKTDSEEASARVVDVFADRSLRNRLRERAEEALRRWRSSFSKCVRRGLGS